MPYPPRTTVFESGFQANPSLGAKLFRSGCTRVAGKPEVPGNTTETAEVGSCENAGLNTDGESAKLATRLLISVNGDTYSYRSPRLNVRLPRAFHSSCAYKSHEFPRKW